jgi:hypothetical protein
MHEARSLKRQARSREPEPGTKGLNPNPSAEPVTPALAFLPALEQRFLSGKERVIS